MFDGVERSIRPILGVPGAAYPGSQSGSQSGLPSDQSWDSVSVAPNGKRALAVSGLSLNLIPDVSQPGSFNSVAQLPGPVFRIVWSGDSTAAATWSVTAGQLQRITAIDSTPVIHDPIDLSALPGTIAGWNMSPDGRYVALSSSASGTASVYFSDNDGTPLPIASLTDPGAVVFSADGSSLFVFNGAKRQILIFDLPSGAVAGSLDASPFEFAKGVAVADKEIREVGAGRRPSAVRGAGSGGFRGWCVALCSRRGDALRVRSGRRANAFVQHSGDHARFVSVHPGGGSAAELPTRLRHAALVVGWENRSDLFCSFGKRDSRCVTLTFLFPRSLL